MPTNFIILTNSSRASVIRIGQVSIDFICSVCHMCHILLGVIFWRPGRHNFARDVTILAVSLAVASGGCYFAYLQHRRAQSHVQKLTKDLSSLQNAEDTLAQMQQQ